MLSGALWTTSDGIHAAAFSSCPAFFILTMLAVASAVAVVQVDYCLRVPCLSPVTIVRIVVVKPKLHTLHFSSNLHPSTLLDTRGVQALAWLLHLSFHVDTVLQLFSFMAAM
jgi:hypothetical protein